MNLSSRIPTVMLHNTHSQCPRCAQYSSCAVYSFRAEVGYEKAPFHRSVDGQVLGPCERQPRKDSLPGAYLSKCRIVLASHAGKPCTVALSVILRGSRPAPSRVFERRNVGGAAEPRDNFGRIQAEKSPNRPHPRLAGS